MANCTEVAWPGHAQTISNLFCLIVIAGELPGPFGNLIASLSTNVKSGGQVREAQIWETR